MCSSQSGYKPGYAIAPSGLLTMNSPALRGAPNNLGAEELFPRGWHLRGLWGAKLFGAARYFWGPPEIKLFCGGHVFFAKRGSPAPWVGPAREHISAAPRESLPACALGHCRAQAARLPGGGGRVKFFPLSFPQEATMSTAGARDRGMCGRVPAPPVWRGLNIHAGPAPGTFTFWRCWAERAQESPQIGRAVLRGRPPFGRALHFGGAGDISRGPPGITLTVWGPY